MQYYIDLLLNNKKITMDTLTKKSFNSLTKTEQAVMVINSGKELLIRQNEEYSIHLYLISNLFVEILYELNKSTIIKIKTPSKEKLCLSYNLNDQELNKYLAS